MGFFSWIASGISSIASGIGKVASSIGSVLSSAAKSIYTAVKTLAPILATWAGNIGTAVRIIGLVIDIVAKIHGMLKEKENVQDIGERVLQAEEKGITLENCKNDFDAYMEKIRNLELNPEKASVRPKEEKILAGCILIEKGLEQQFPNMTTAPMWPIIIRNPDFFTHTRLETYAQMAKERDLPLGDSVAKYFVQYPNKRVDRPTRDFLFDAEKKLDPSATKNDIQEKLDTVEKNSNQAAKNVPFQ
ncbi:MAG: hypothetical protein IJU76_15450 [Desulfovibrionaceae bacterium]|nr:hypothetical protein [Desulfovibrionaceae bacterium]